MLEDQGLFKMQIPGIASKPDESMGPRSLPLQPLPEGFFFFLILLLFYLHNKV